MVLSELQRCYDSLMVMVFLTLPLSQVTCRWCILFLYRPIRPILEVVIVEFLVLEYIEKYIMYASGSAELSL